MQGHLPFTPSIRVEILGVNMQGCSFFKHKMEKSQNQNVLVSIGKLKKKKKTCIEWIAYNAWNISNGMVCTISFSNQKFLRFSVKMKSTQNYSLNFESHGGQF